MSITRELGIAGSLLQKWKRQVVETSSESERKVLVLKMRVRELEMGRDILKGGAYLRQERIAKYQFITGE